MRGFMGIYLKNWRAKQETGSTRLEKTQSFSRL